MDAPTPGAVEFPPEDRRVGRRALLGMLGLGGLGVLFGSRVQSGLEDLLRPLTMNDQTGLTAFLPTGGRFRIYSVTGSFPLRTDEEYRLTLAGAVERPLVLDITDLRNRLPQTDLTRDFQCVTGWRVEDVPWRGVKISDLLAEAGVHADATHLRFRSFDGVYTETLTLDQAGRDDVIVAHQMLGADVTRDHGGPVRLYVAPMYGYKSLKWLDRIEVVTALDEPTDPGYWENLGYETDAWVGTSNGLTDTPIS